MPIHVPSSQLPELYLPDWTKIRASNAQTSALESQSALNQRKADREEAQENALSKYMQSGDLKGLMAADPKTGISLMSTMRQNQLAEGTLAAKQQELKIKQYEFLQKAIPSLTLQTYPLLMQQAKDMGLVTGFKDPTQVTQEDINTLKQGALSYLDQLNATYKGNQIAMQPLEQQSKQLDIQGKQEALATPKNLGTVSEGGEQVNLMTKGGEVFEAGRGPRWNPKEKVMTPDEAQKELVDLRMKQERLGKATQMDAILAAIAPGLSDQIGKPLDEPTKEQLNTVIEQRVARLNQIISGGGSTAATTGAPAASNVGSLLSGKPPGRYRVNGVEVKWNGTSAF